MARTSSHTPHWNTFKRPHTMGRIVTADLVLMTLAPIKRTSQLMIVTFTRGDRSTLSLKEYMSLELIEEVVASWSEQICDGYFVGRITCPYKRVLISYLPQEIVDLTTLRERLKGFKHAHYEISVEEDPGWKYYLNELAVSDQELRHIEDKRVLEGMLRGGDDLITERPIKHWAYFATHDNAQRFLTALQNKGFQYATISHTPEQSPRPWEAECTNISSMDGEIFEQLIDSMSQLAESFDGEYDGWESADIGGWQESSKSDRT